MQIDELVYLTKDEKNPEFIWTQARTAAINAVNLFVEKHGEPMYCGFSSAVIRPARGFFISHLKKIGIGSKHWKKGWSINYYDILRNHQYGHTQSMDIKEEATETFCKVLKMYGIDCYSESRAD